jgi:transposase
VKPLTIADSESIILGLQDEIRRSEEARYDHRLHGVLLVAHGLTCPAVGRLLGDAPRTVEYWVNSFEQQGLAGLREGERPGRPQRLSAAQVQEIDAILRKTPRAAGLSANLWDGKALSAWIDRQYGARLGVRQCQRMFRQLGFRLRKPRPAIAQANPELQRLYKKLRVLMREESVDLWATDEVQFQQHGSRCRMWVPPEIKDPVLLHAPTRQSVGYFGAVRLCDGRFVFRQERDKFNAATFFGFLRDLRRVSMRRGRRVVVIADNAKYHHSGLHKPWREQQAPGFVLDFLPPYSPELNPIERVWKLTRRLCLHNRYFTKLEEVIMAVEAEFGTWTKRNEALRRLCAII